VNPVRYDALAVRAAEFPWTGSSDIVYLNHAATGPLPSRSVALVHDWTERRRQPWTITDHDVVFPALRHTREVCARLVGASADEIALMSNTSYGLNLAAQALPLEPGDVVLVPDGEFPTVVAVWRRAQHERGIEVRLVPARDGLPDEDALLDALRGPRVRAIAVSWVGFANGFRMNLERLGAACRERGVFFVVDAIQGLGAAALDVRACNIDVLACGGFKWLLAPWGAGFAYVRRELITGMEPPALGWLFGPRQEDYTRMLEYDAPLYDDARRFEVMTLPSQDLAALGTSVDLLLELGPGSVEAHVTALADGIVDWARQRSDVRLVTPAEPERRAGIVSIALPDAFEVSRRLRAAGVIHSLRQGALRFSPYLYNTANEIDAMLRIMDDALTHRTVVGAR
jgi:cysteine desulfurase / selenocysteine lyase